MLSFVISGGDSSRQASTRRTPCAGFAPHRGKRGAERMDLFVIATSVFTALTVGRGTEEQPGRPRWRNPPAWYCLCRPSITRCPRHRKRRWTVWSQPRQTFQLVDADPTDWSGRSMEARRNVAETGLRSSTRSENQLPRRSAPPTTKRSAASAPPGRGEQTRHRLGAKD